jgi:hypothetical protein
MANLNEKTITRAWVNPSKGFGGKAAVYVEIEGKEVKLFEFYDDELHFSPEEFIGLTLDQGHKLFTKKDVAYLQSS